MKITLVNVYKLLKIHELLDVVTSCPIVVDFVFAVPDEIYDEDILLLNNESFSDVGSEDDEVTAVENKYLFL